jgi:hypothetical protein
MSLDQLFALCKELKIMPDARLAKTVHGRIFFWEDSAYTVFVSQFLFSIVFFLRQMSLQTMGSNATWIIHSFSAISLASNEEWQTGPQ